MIELVLDLLRYFILLTRNMECLWIQPCLLVNLFFNLGTFFKIFTLLLLLGGNIIFPDSPEFPGEYSTICSMTSDAEVDTVFSYFFSNSSWLGILRKTKVFKVRSYTFLIKTVFCMIEWWLNDDYFHFLPIFKKKKYGLLHQLCTFLKIKFWLLTHFL